LLRFLVDENLPVEIGLLLRDLGHDVLIVRRSPLVQASDPVLWACAVRERRVIVTRDKDFPLRGVRGKPVGVILLRAHDPRRKAIVSLFQEHWSRLSARDVVGHIVVMAPGHLRRRAFR
jgi:predicted nuclease of predicted toxin-antitoxin system